MDPAPDTNRPEKKPGPTPPTIRSWQNATARNARPATRWKGTSLRVFGRVAVFGASLRLGRRSGLAAGLVLGLLRALALLGLLVGLALVGGLGRVAALGLREPGGRGGLRVVGGGLGGGHGGH